MREIAVNTSESYKITLSNTPLSDIGSVLAREFSGSKIAIITDSNVDKLYAAEVIKSLESADFCVIKYVFEAGEANKTLVTYGKIAEFLARNNFSRSDILVALGGGVVGDITGFAAGTYMRGVRYIQIPTTLLACVDSSVGGKCAVDLPQGKNLVGIFKQPNMVIMRTQTLKTLPKSTFYDGMGEVLKYAVLRGGELYDSLMSDEQIDIEEMISACVNIKREIVERDEFDMGERRLLNLGHTFGHAIEKIENYTLPHGEAIAIGLRYCLEFSEMTGELNLNDKVKILALLDKYDVPPMSYDKRELSLHISLDKKIWHNDINFVLIKGLGDCVIEPISFERLKEYSNVRKD